MSCLSQGLGRWQEEGADCCTVRGWGGQRAHSALAPHHSLGHEPAVYGLQVRVPTSPSLLGQGQKSPPPKKSHSTYYKIEESLFRLDHLSHKEMCGLTLPTPVLAHTLLTCLEKRRKIQSPYPRLDNKMLLLTVLQLLEASQQHERSVPGLILL